MDIQTQLPSKTRVQLGSSSTSSESSTRSFNSIDQNAPDSPPSVCIQAVCDSMKRQIISRAFYGWLAYCRHLSTVRTHLSGLVNATIVSGDDAKNGALFSRQKTTPVINFSVFSGLTVEKWNELCVNGVVKDSEEIYRLAYFGGIAHELRKDLWPYLLGHYKFGTTEKQRELLSEETKQAYENTMSEWLAVEAIVKQRDKEIQANAIAKLSSESVSGEQAPTQIQRELSNDVFEDMSDEDYESIDEDDGGEHEVEPDASSKKTMKTKQNTIKYESDEENAKENGDSKREEAKNSTNNEDNRDDFVHNVIVTNASLDMSNLGTETTHKNNILGVVDEETVAIDCIEAHGLASPARSACVSPASSNGGVYSVSTKRITHSKFHILSAFQTELLETFGLNLHRIEKDVQRCDRNYWYFTGDNLDKLRNIMCT